MHILIQESQRKVGGRRENKNYVPETKEQRGGGPLFKSSNTSANPPSEFFESIRFRRPASSDSSSQVSIASSTQVKGLAAEVRARPLRK
jgi:hypothetical protein